MYQGRSPWTFAANAKNNWFISDTPSDPIVAQLNEREKVEREERLSTSWTSVHRLETISAVWSTVLLLVSIVLCIVPRFRDFELPLWWTVPQVYMSDQSSAVSTYTAAWSDLCPAHNAHPVNAQRYFPKVDSDGVTAVTVVTGTEQWEVGFRPMWMLAWIFFVSVIFQGARADPNFPVVSYVRKALGYEVTAYVEILRWIEYALTSPFQLWLVCASFFIGDFATLVSVALAQAGLVLLGGLIEYYVCTAYKKNVKYLEQTQLAASYGPADKVEAVKGKRDSYYNCSVFLLIVAWTTHVVLWIPVLMSFFRLDKHFTDCTTGNEFVKQWEDVRGVIYFIIFSQFITFTLFGVRLTWTVVFDCIETKLELYSARVRDSKFYAVLSVVAKSALDLGFVLFVLRMSETPV